MVRTEGNESGPNQTSDKGGNVVLWPIKMYERKMYRQLRDEKFYKQFTFNPLSKYRIQLTNILLNALENRLLSKQQFDGLIMVESTIATISLLPKIHKNCPLNQVQTISVANK